MAKRLPLSAVLGLQVLVVAAAFIAVILVLSEQQRKEFKDSLYTQLELRQNFVIGSVTSPLFQRMQIFDFAVDSYMAGKKGDGVYARPSDDRTNSQLDDTLPFYEHFYIYAQEDPTFHFISISNQSRRFYAPYNGTDHPTVWNLWALDSSKLLTIYENETADACFGSFPMTITPACFFQFPLNTAVTLGPVVEYGRNMRYLWYGSSIADPTNPEGKAHVLSYTISPKWKPSVVETPADLEDHYIVFSASLSVNHIRPTIVKHLTLPSSRSAVFSKNDNVQYGYSEFLFLSGAVDFTDFDEKVLEETGYALAAAWRAGKTPDEALNKAFIIANAGIDRDASDAYVFEFSSGGRKYVGCAGRFVSLVHDMNWLLLEYTPREDFFGASDRARVTGIVIGAMGGLVVLVVCILIWVAIQVPLRELGASMGLAADMRNDEVVHGDPVLSEIGALNDAFRQMNNKLLAARPFLPQSLLRASNTTDEEEDEEDYDFDHDDDDPLTSVVKVTVARSEDGDSTADDRTTNATPSTYSRGTSNAAVIKRSASEGTAASSRGKLTQQVRKAAGRAAVVSSSTNKQLVNVMASGPSSRNALGRELLCRRVAVLSINVLGFNDMVASTAAANITGPVPQRTQQYLLKTHSMLAKLIETAVGEERGIVDYFHGDRFVCGFNTARVCGNAARNGAECAAKIWDRFVSFSADSKAAPYNRSNDDAFSSRLDTTSNNNNKKSTTITTRVNDKRAGGAVTHAVSSRVLPTTNELLQAFPHGLAMGLGVGRAAVGNHGTDTMQRLGTIGGPYSEAMRLMDVMSRRVLMGCGGQRGAVSSSSPSAGVPQPNPLVVGRCLVMGRVIQELETSKVYCQIVGGVEARELLGSCASERSVANFVKNKNELTLDRTFMSMVTAEGNPVFGKATTSAPVKEEDPNSTKSTSNVPPPVGPSTFSPVSKFTSQEGTAAAAGAQQREGDVKSTTVLVGTIVSSLILKRSNRLSSSPFSNNKGSTFENEAEMDAVGDEWLYELKNSHARNPFTTANNALYRLWNDGFIEVPPPMISTAKHQGGHAQVQQNQNETEHVQISTNSGVDSSNNHQQFSSSTSPKHVSSPVTAKGKGLMPTTTVVADTTINVTPICAWVNYVHNVLSATKQRIEHEHESQKGQVGEQQAAFIVVDNGATPTASSGVSTSAPQTAPLLGNEEPLSDFSYSKSKGSAINDAMLKFCYF